MFLKPSPHPRPHLISGSAWPHPEGLDPPLYVIKDWFSFGWCDSFLPFYLTIKFVVFRLNWRSTLNPLPWESVERQRQRNSLSRPLELKNIACLLLVVAPLKCFAFNFTLKMCCYEENALLRNGVSITDKSKVKTLLYWSSLKNI